MEPAELAGGLDWTCGISKGRVKDDLRYQIEQLVDWLYHFLR